MEAKVVVRKSIEIDITDPHKNLFLLSYTSDQDIEFCNKGYALVGWVNDGTHGEVHLFAPIGPEGV